MTKNLDTRYKLSMLLQLDILKIEKIFNAHSNSKLNYTNRIILSNYHYTLYEYLGCNTKIL